MIPGEKAVVCGGGRGSGINNNTGFPSLAGALKAVLGTEPLKPLESKVSGEDDDSNNSRRHTEIVNHRK